MSTRLPGVLLAMIVMIVAGCQTASPAYQDQRAFADPESAVTSLLAAARSGDEAGMKAIFGPEGDEILSSGDPVQDRRQLEVFVVAMGEGWSLEDTGRGVKELIVGHEQWPFPAPLVRDVHGWWFDTIAGAYEVLARRIGRNELAVIGTLRTYVFAQEDYAGEGRDGMPAGRFAQRLRSTPGKHDGLYWNADAVDGGPSPLSHLAAGAAIEGYTDDNGDEPRPFHGYFFRILTRQGENAPGGARSYVVDGRMTGGFAAIAYPADYENSGIMTFQVGRDGIVYERDLGEDTEEIASKIEAFDPGEGWRSVD